MQLGRNRTLDSRKQIRSNNLNAINNLKTCELVEELKEREGVKVYLAEPYKDLNINVNGPAIVLVVTD